MRTITDEEGHEMGQNGQGWPSQAGRYRPFLGPFVPFFDLDDPRAIYSPLPRSTHHFIRHSLPRSREERDTFRRGEGRASCLGFP
jgi:hypothetical protein